jgi:hypothetical protein
MAFLANNVLIVLIVVIVLIIVIIVLIVPITFKALGQWKS